ncbi:Charged multivesicular body protein 2a [Trichinella spiralis]|uniref:Charged multivesicular body protein 2a n=1 Tax=Trichinella spiralis TaxID=6334 RepID=A0ABR3KJ17_TRISP
MFISRVINAFSQNSFALRLEEVIDNTGQHGFEELADLGKIRGYNAKNRKCISYPKLPSAIGPFTQGPDVPIPLPPDNMDTVVLSDEESSEETINQGLSKVGAEALGSRLQSKHMLAPGTIVSMYRKRETEFTPFFGE